MNPWLPRVALKSHVRRRLASLLRYAYRHNAFYRERFAMAGICHVDELSRPDAIERLPILSKAEIRSAGDARFSDGFSKEASNVSTTSGSTGQPLSVCLPDEAYGYALLCFYRSASWAGCRPHHLIAYIKSGGEDAGAYGPWFRTSHIASTPGTTGDILRRILETKPDVLVTNVAQLQALVEVDELALQSIGLTAVVVGGAMSHRDERRELASILGCPVVDEYSTKETWAIASECRHGSYHLAVDNTFLEVLRDDGTPCLPGETGRAIVTALMNRGAPYIRYEVGDRVAVAPEQETCPCGRSFPMLQTVEGRVLDRLVGIEVTPLQLISLVRSVEGSGDLGPWQLYQSRLGELEFQYVRRSEADLVPVGNRVAERLRENLSVHVTARPVGPFADHPDAKRRIIRSSLAD